MKRDGKIFPINLTSILHASVASFFNKRQQNFFLIYLQQTELGLNRQPLIQDVIPVLMTQPNRIENSDDFFMKRDPAYDKIYKSCFVFKNINVILNFNKKAKMILKFTIELFIKHVFINKIRFSGPGDEFQDRCLLKNLKLS